MNKKYISIKVIAVLLVLITVISSFSSCSFLEDLASDYVSVDLTHKILSESKNNEPIYSCSITATIKNNFTADIKDGTVNLVLPSGCTVIEPENSVEVDVVFGDSETVSWEIEIPVTTEDQNIEISVNLSADGIAPVTSYDSIFVNGLNENDNRLDFNVDTWNFKNYSVSKIPLTQDDYNALVYPFSNIDRSILKTYVNTRAGGQCYGMASTCILKKLDRYPLDKLDADAECLHDVDKNDAAKSFIGYYYLMQFISPASDMIAKYFGMSDIDVLDELIELSDSVKNGGTPILFCFYGENDVQSYGHAVVAYGNEVASYSHDGIEYTNCILIYDNNRPKWTSDAYLYYNESGDWYMPAYPDATKLGMVTNKMEIIDFQNLEQTGKSVNSYITARGTHNLTIKSSNNETWNINGAGKVSENVVAYYDIGDSSEGNLNIAINNNGNPECLYEITPNEKEEITLSTVYENYYLTASTDAGNTVVVDPVGAIQIKGEAEDFSIKIVSDLVDSSSMLSEVYVTAKEGTDTSVSVNENGYVLSGKDLSKVQITTSNNTASNLSKVADVPETVFITTEDNKLVVKSDKDNDGIPETVISTGKEVKGGEYFEKSGFPGVWLYVAIGVAIVAAAVVAFFITKHIKNKKKMKIQSSEDYWGY